MAPIKSLLALVAFSTAVSAVAQVHGEIRDGRGLRGGNEYCPPDPTYYCPPGYTRPEEPGRPPRYPDPYPPGRPGYPPPPPHRPDPGYPYPNPGYGTERREITLYRNLVNERINLNDYVNSGAILESVEVVSSSYNSYATVNLLVDRMIEDSRYAPSSYVTLYPRSSVSMVRGGRMVQLEVQGNVYIERIILNLRGNGGYYPPAPGPGYGQVDLTQSLYRVYNGNGLVDIGQLVNMHAYRGYRVVSVKIRGRSAAGFGTAEVLADGMSMGSNTLPTYTMDAWFYPSSYRNVIGTNLQQLLLRLNGNNTIETVTVTVAR